MQIRQIEYQDVSQFSQRDKDYCLNSEIFKDFIQYEFDYSNFPAVIENRKSVATNRALLQRIAKAQYEGLDSSNDTKALLEDLADDNCFTICTAHQPSLLTGPLYYVFKILSAIKLAKRLNADHSDLKIVPVFILGAEDHDFEEVNHFHLFGKTISWERDSQGAVGRYSTEGLDAIIDQLFDILGEQSKLTELRSNFDTILKESIDYADFSFRITHLLFDHLGLVILRMDDKDLKAEFKSHMLKELTERPSQGLIEQTQNRLEALGYSKQAHAREINLFYHCAEGRKRIEFEDGIYKVVDTDIRFNQSELERLLDESPENFSPNVALRPLYQECILPNLAYIGGGGELAYWMERKTQFAHFGIPFPMLIRRNSAMLVKGGSIKHIEKTGFSISDYFDDEQELIKRYIDASENEDFHLTEYTEEMDGIFARIEDKVKKIDPSLVSTVGSELAKIKKSLGHLENKLSKSIKRKEEVSINRISKLKAKLFPSGLQERHDSIMEFISSHGIGLLDDLLDHMDPFDKDMKIFILQDPER